MRYYGCKDKLLTFIEDAVKQTGVNETSTFVDLFSGTGVVGKHFKKKGFTVYANDTLEFAYALSKAYIELNKEPEFKKLGKEIKSNGSIQSIFDYLNGLDDFEKGFMFRNYSPNGGRTYFSDENALRIDTIRKKINEWKDANVIKELEYYYLITSLLEAVNLVSNVSGTYAACLKTWDNRALKPLKLAPVKVIPSNNKNKAFKNDANELIKKIKPDILYLDPPYNTRQYASNYFILELIAEGWFYKEPTIYGVTGMREYDHQKSDYCSKNKALNALEDLILNSAKAQYVLLSYNNEGIIPNEAILDTLNRIGEVEIYKEKHKRYKSINQTVEDDPQLTFEHLFVVKPKKIVNKTNWLTGKEWLENSFSIWRNLGKNEEEKKLKHPAIFTVKLVTKLIETFCRPQKSLVLDPFAGSGTTLIAGLSKGMDVAGFDINPKFKQIFQNRAKHSYGMNPYNSNTKYFVHDARKLTEKLQADSVDLCITSPPYWDILNRKRTADYKKNVNYSNSKDDLGNIEDYQEFLNCLKDVVKEVRTVLKPKAYFILNVMDLRKKDKFFPLHMDCTQIGREVGFKFEDIIIWDRQLEYNNMRPLGYPHKFIVNKVHEYLLIFRKVEQ